MKFIKSAFLARAFIAALLAFIITTALVQTSFAQADPLIGRWMFNAAKSTFTPGPAPWRSATLNYQADGQGLKNTIEGVDSEGKPIRAGFTIVNDGKYYAVTGVPDFDSSAFKRIDAYTVEYTRMKAGKVVFSGKRVLSGDSKILTFTESGVNAKGQQVSSVVIYDKQ